MIFRFLEKLIFWSWEWKKISILSIFYSSLDGEWLWKIPRFEVSRNFEHVGWGGLKFGIKIFGIVIHHQGLFFKITDFERQIFDSSSRVCSKQKLKIGPFQIQLSQNPGTEISGTRDLWIRTNVFWIPEIYVVSHMKLINSNWKKRSADDCLWYEIISADACFFDSNRKKISR